MEKLEVILTSEYQLVPVEGDFFLKSQCLHSAILSGTFFAETHQLNLIMEKHHVNAYWRTFYKITSLYSSENVQGIEERVWGAVPD